MKQRVFVDTNIFLRFFTRDDGGQHQRARDFFEAANQGKLDLVTGPPVLFELYWTLTSAYEQKVDKALDVLESILSQDSITVTDGNMVQNAIQRAREAGEEFPDAYICALAESSNCQKIATFNVKDFKALGAPLYKL